MWGRLRRGSSRVRSRTKKEWSHEAEGKRALEGQSSQKSKNAPQKCHDIKINRDPFGLAGKSRGQRARKSKREHWERTEIFNCRKQPSPLGPEKWKEWEKATGIQSFGGEAPWSWALASKKGVLPSRYWHLWSSVKGLRELGLRGGSPLSWSWCLGSLKDRPSRVVWDLWGEGHEDGSVSAGRSRKLDSTIPRGVWGCCWGDADQSRFQPEPEGRWAPYWWVKAS